MCDSKCAFLDVVFCRGDEHCQYKMTTACYPLGEKYCGIEVMRSHVKGGMCEECRSRPYKGDAVLEPEKSRPCNDCPFTMKCSELAEKLYRPELRTKEG